MKWSWWVHPTATAFSRKQMVTWVRGLRCGAMMEAAIEVGPGGRRQSQDSLLRKMQAACACRDASTPGSTRLPQVWKPWAWGPVPVFSEDQKDTHKNWLKLAKNIYHGKFWEENLPNFGFRIYLDQSVLKYGELGCSERKKKNNLASLKSNKELKTFAFPKQSYFSSPEMSDWKILCVSLFPFPQVKETAATCREPSLWLWVGTGRKVWTGMDMGMGKTITWKKRCSVKGGGCRVF